MSQTLTHRVGRYLECDLCFWPIAQGRQFLVEGDVVRHPVCPDRPPRMPPQLTEEPKA